MGDFRMPSLGADMDAGTVSEWLVKPGDEVHRGDIVAVVETEKSTIEVEIFESGVVDEILVEVGQHVPVGTVLARLIGTGPSAAHTAPGASVAVAHEAAPNVPSVIEEGPIRRPVPTVAATEAPAEAVGPVVPAMSETRSAPSPAPAGATGPGRVFSPVIRHLAERLGVELTSLDGSGPGGMVTRADVEKAAKRTTGPSARRVRSSPLARRLAAEHGIDLSAVPGTGPGGSVVEHDVQLVVSLATSEPAARPATGTESVTKVPVAEEPTAAVVEGRQAAMRKAIGALMARSKREIPHYYLSTTIDLSSASAWLERANLERPVSKRLVAPVLLLKATALAVARVPEMNGFMVNDESMPSEVVHVGVAVSLRTGGVIAPAIHNADKLSLDELMRALKNLVGRARKGVLRSSEMSDPTITVTNLGDLGVEAVFGVIYPPQVALVGFGRIAQRPWASDGMLGVRPCVTATLSADHRASDGHRGGLFLGEIDRLLQDPENLR